jgi:demethylmenaquinone methyltransferase/2-methoxy-6-polyprenyl-1,4-benzoquinol methylase
MMQDGQNGRRISDRVPEDMPTSFGFTTVGEGEKQALVDDVFHKVADRYDLMNDLMSGGHAPGLEGRHGLGPGPAEIRPARLDSLLDVAGGTGDIATRVVRRQRIP